MSPFAMILVFRKYHANGTPDNSVPAIDRECNEPETQASIIRELQAAGYELEGVFSED